MAFTAKEITERQQVEKIPEEVLCPFIIMLDSAITLKQKRHQYIVDGPNVTFRLEVDAAILTQIVQANTDQIGEELMAIYNRAKGFEWVSVAFRDGLKSPAIVEIYITLTMINQ